MDHLRTFVLTALVCATVFSHARIVDAAGICFSGYVRYQWYDAEDHAMRAETNFGVCGSRPPCSPLISIVTPPPDRDKFFFSFSPNDLVETIALDAGGSLGFGLYFRNTDYTNAEDFQTFNMGWTAFLGNIHYSFPYYIHIDGIPTPESAGSYRGEVVAYTENLTQGTPDFRWGFAAIVRRISPNQLTVANTAGELWSSNAKLLCADIDSSSYNLNYPFIVVSLNAGRVVVVNHDTFSNVLSDLGIPLAAAETYNVTNPIGGYWAGGWVTLDPFTITFASIGQGRLIDGGGASSTWSMDWLETGTYADPHPLPQYRDLARAFNLLAADCNSNGLWDTCDLDCGAAGSPCDVAGCGQSADCNSNGIPDECEPQEDCQPNGVQDICDIAAGTSQDCDANGVPDECQPPTDCNENLTPDFCDIAAGTSQDCNANGFPDECEVPPIGIGPDCNGNGVPDDCEVDCNTNLIPDDCDLVSGISNDCDGNGVPDECEPWADCQPNGIQDICDIAGGSADCNMNGIPDECEPDCNNNFVSDECDILIGFSADCNNNGVPDECDIANGAANDCQGNGIPDQCDLEPPADAIGQDDCYDAELVCPGNEYFGSTYNETNDGEASCALSQTTPDMWYVYVPKVAGVAVISLVGSEYDNALSIHTGCPGSIANEIVCNDDWCGTQARLTLTVSAGEAYWIRISGWNGSTGVYRLTLTGPACEFNADCNGNGFPDECDITNGTSPDCNGNGVPDECDIANDSSQDILGAGGLPDGIPDECQNDCNGNGTLDGQDIASGTSQDCNGNGVPDECEPDSDGDGVIDACDNCPSAPNGPALGSCVDNGGGGTCMSNEDCAAALGLSVGVCSMNQEDSDNDGIGDACDTDDDNDGVPDAGDNCPRAYNPGQEDIDNDGNGDACDLCPGFDDKLDADGDGVPNGCDNCMTIPNPVQRDFDQDGIGDVCDGDFVDTDGDHVPDGVDNCPTVYNPNQANMDGDAFGDACDDDVDGDGIPNALDNCPLVPNPNQSDSDGDTVGDVCDQCPGFDDKADADGDGVANDCDNCMNVANVNQMDRDGNGVGDACDDDIDGDGIPNALDNCPLIFNPDQADSDNDLVGDVCDTCPGFDNRIDVDLDGVPDGCDNCDADFNPNQADLDGDGLGDVCDPDQDGDGILDAVDNCRIVFNPGQADSDGDGIGDCCDPDQPDTDGDGVADACDNCLTVPNGPQEAGIPGVGNQTDSNGDGTGDACELCGDLDGDTDVDGNDFSIFLSAYGRCAGDAGYDALADLDSDGCVNLVDYQQWLHCFRVYTGAPLANRPMPSDIGDMNGDGVVNGMDIQGFVGVLTQPNGAGFREIIVADVNGDAALDAADVGQFVTMLVGQP